MAVDLISLLVFVILAGLGWRSGALRQALRIGAILAVILGAPFVSPIIRELIFGESRRASPVIEVLSVLGSGILIYLTVTLGAWLAVRILRAAAPTLSVVDRVGGASIGAVKAAILIYLGVTLVVFLQGPLLEYDPENKLGLREGALTGFVARHNVLAPWQFPDLNRLHEALRLAALVEQEGGQEMVRDNEDAAEALRDDRVDELLGDEELMQWVAADHYPMTLADSRVRDLLNDDGFIRRLKAVDWEVLKTRVEAGS